ncbi:hypothetical protein GCM10027058_16310 [Microbacterium neimengense]
MTSMPQPTAETGSTSHTLAVLTHLGGILFSFIPSLIVFLVQRGTGSSLYEQAKEALNLQITVALGMVVAGSGTGLRASARPGTQATAAIGSSAGHANRAR